MAALIKAVQSTVKGAQEQAKADMMAAKLMLSKQSLFEIATPIASRHLEALLRVGTVFPGVDPSDSLEALQSIAQEKLRFWSFSDLLREIQERLQKERTGEI